MPRRSLTVAEAKCATAPPVIPWMYRRTDDVYNFQIKKNKKLRLADSANRKYSQRLLLHNILLPWFFYQRRHITVTAIIAITRIIICLSALLLSRLLTVIIILVIITVTAAAASTAALICTAATQDIFSRYESVKVVPVKQSTK